MPLPFVTPLAVLFHLYAFWQWLPPLGRLFTRHVLPYLVMLAPWISLSMQRIDAKYSTDLWGLLIVFLGFLFFSTIFVFGSLYWGNTEKSRQDLLNFHKESGLPQNQLFKEIEENVQSLPYWETRLLRVVWKKERQDAWRIMSCAKALIFSLNESVRPSSTFVSPPVKPRRRL